MIRFGSGYGSGRNNTPYTTLKIAVVHTDAKGQGEGKREPGLTTNVPLVICWILRERIGRLG